MKSKLAITSFILSLTPIIITVFILLGLMIIGPGTPSPSRIIATFFFAFFGFLPFYSLFLIASIVLGIIALKKIKKSNLEGRRFAIVGISLSALFIITFIVFFILTNGKGVA